jgi:superfamily II DNA or RNA helicase
MSKNKTITKNLFLESNGGLIPFSNTGKWAFHNNIIDEAKKRYKRKENGTICVATGGGKTEIANRLIYDLRIGAGDNGFRVLWVSKDWALLFQSAKAYYHRFLQGEDPSEYLSRCGGAKEWLCFLKNEMDDDDEFYSDQVYTTIHTLSKDYFFERNACNFDLVIVDESHWGSSGSMYNDVYNICKKNKVVVIGLSATPSKKNFPIIDRIYDRNELEQKKIIAKANLMSPVETGCEINNTKLSAGDFSVATLKELADDRSRNKIIVESYNPKIHRKTILFACSIDHINILRKMFNSKHGDSLPCYVLHHKLDVSERRKNLSYFKSKRGACILINLDMAATGIDVPDIKTVFSVRPTTSNTWYQQAILGRACRWSEDKKEFNIVEFTDNFDKHKELVISASKILSETAHRNTRRFPTETIKYEPSSFQKDFIVFTQDKELHLPINENMTFGVEFEFTVRGVHDYEYDTLKPYADQVIAHFKKYLGDNRVASKFFEYDEAVDYKKFCVQRDGSCGFEIITPILQGHDGFDLLVTEFAEAISTCKITKDKEECSIIDVSFQTGLHIHLGFKLPKGEALKNLFLNYLHFESMLPLFLNPSRMVSFLGHQSYNCTLCNEYCISLNMLIRDRFEDIENFNLHTFSTEIKSSLQRHVNFKDKDLRYLGLNFSNFINGGNLDTLEIRYHHGTKNMLEVVCWISLWMVLLEKFKLRVLSNNYPKSGRIADKLPVCNMDPIQDKHFKEDLNVFLDGSGPDLLNYFCNKKNYIQGLWFKNVFKINKKLPKYNKNLNLLKIQKDDSHIFFDHTGDSHIAQPLPGDNLSGRSRQSLASQNYSCVEFKDLKSNDDKKHVAQLLIKRNDLNIKVDELVKRFYREPNDFFFYGWLSSNSKHLMSAAYKRPWQAILKKVLNDEFELFKNAKNSNKALKSLQENIKSRKIIEFGYLTNTTKNDPSCTNSIYKKRWRHIQEKVMYKLKTDFPETSIIAIVKHDNFAAIKLAERNGFRKLLTIQTPKENKSYRLILMIHEP